MTVSRTVLVLLTACLALTATTLLAVQDQGPETIDLQAKFAINGTQPAVIFAHRLHQESMGQKCESCHQQATGGGKIRFELTRLTGAANDFHKNFCWPCHDEMGLSVGKKCVTCHVRGN